MAQDKDYEIKTEKYLIKIKQVTPGRWGFILRDPVKNEKLESKVVRATFDISQGFKTKKDAEKIAFLVLKRRESNAPWIISDVDLKEQQIEL